MRKVAAFLQSLGLAGGFGLAFLDSAGLPLPGGVDALILLTAATNPTAAYPTAAISVVGSVLGSLLLYWLARKGGELYLERHAATARARQVREWVGQYGSATVFIAMLVPIPGMPTKLVVLTAGALGVGPLEFLVTVVAGRVPRYFALAALGLQLGHDALGWLGAHKWQLTGGAVALCLSLMLLLRVVRRNPA